MPAENPFDISGIAPMGRWAYGPYFWPPTNNLYQPVANPYYSPLLRPEPTRRPRGARAASASRRRSPAPPTPPGAPRPSWTPRPSTAPPIPSMTVEPKAYRFRILNAAHDRFFNLAFYQADTTVDPNVANPACATRWAAASRGRRCAWSTPPPRRSAPPRPAARFCPSPDTWPADGREGGRARLELGRPELGHDRRRKRLPAAAGGHPRRSRSPGTSTSPPSTPATSTAAP